MKSLFEKWSPALAHMLFLTLFPLAQASADMAHSTHGDPPATHGMFLFGDKQIYASHLPMFHSPHDYQLILKVSLGDIPRSETLKTYEKYKTQGSEFFTIEPQKMDLTKVMSSEIVSFYANLYLGHFERGGENLGPVQVQVEKIVYQKKLTPEGEEKEEYLVFGQEGEYYASHLIKGKSSYDAILKVSLLTRMNLDCHARICPKHPVFDFVLPIEFYLSVDSNIQEKISTGNVLYRLDHAFDQNDPKNISGKLTVMETEVLKVLYFEEDELSH